MRIIKEYQLLTKPEVNRTITLKESSKIGSFFCVIFARYMLIAIEQRESEDYRVLGDDVLVAKKVDVRYTVGIMK